MGAEMNYDHRDHGPRRVGQVKEVTSLANPIIKDIKALTNKKSREESGTFLAEGLKLVIDAIELGWAIRTLVYAKGAKGKPLVEQMAARTVASGGLVLEVSEKVIASITRRDNPQMVVGIFEQRWKPLRDIRPRDGETWVALDRVRDPGNLGTIIRTVDAVGGGGVILVGECCDPYSVEAVRATMGSVFAVALARADEAAFAEWRKAWPGSVAGTLLSAGTDYRSADYRAPAMILLGNEQQGLTPEMASLCDVNVKIPMRGRADSLNLSVAAGIMLYAALP
jgi:TrmH family RNA methyltransferase